MIRARRTSWLSALAFLTCLTLLACGDDGSVAGPSLGDMSSGAGDTDGGARPVSFSRDIEPLLRARCRVCHNPASAVGDDLVDAFDSEHGLVNRANTWAEVHDSPFEVLVAPGKPDESFLLAKVSMPSGELDEANNGAPMPLHVPRVTADELSAIKQWIRDGAKNDAFFKERVAPVFGTERTLGRRRGKCTLCHYPGSPTGLDILAVFDEEEGLVGAPSVLSDKLRVAPGDPDASFLVEKIEDEKPSAGAQMPLHYPRLDAFEVGLIRRWIADGARDN